LAASALAAEPEECERLRIDRDSLDAQALNAEIALARSIRERICPALQRQAEAAPRFDEAAAPIDFDALIRCRQEAEAELQSTRAVLYANRRQFRFYTPEGARLAKQADALARQLEGQELRPNCAISNPR
jgi:hypothetical protein